MTRGQANGGKPYPHKTSADAINRIERLANKFQKRVELAIPTSKQRCRYDLQVTENLRFKSDLTMNFFFLRRATSLSAPSRSSPKRKSRTVPSRNGSVSELGTPLGKASLGLSLCYICLFAASLMGRKAGAGKRRGRKEKRTCCRTICDCSRDHLSPSSCFLAHRIIQCVSSNTMLTESKCRYNAKRRHWRKTRLGI